MIYICAICSAKRKPLTHLVAEHRQLLEAILTQVIDMVDIRNCMLFNCTDCKLMLESILNFQQTALIGVKNIQLQYHTVNKPEPSTEHAYAKATTLTIKIEPELEVPTVTQEFIALSDTDPLREELDIKFEAPPASDVEDYYDSESTLSCESPKPELDDTLTHQPTALTVKSKPSQTALTVTSKPSQTALTVTSKPSQTALTVKSNPIEVIKQETPYNTQGNTLLGTLLRLKKGKATEPRKKPEFVKIKSKAECPKGSGVLKRCVVKVPLGSKVLKRVEATVTSQGGLSHDRVPEVDTKPIKSEGGFEVFTHQVPSTDGLEQKPVAGTYLSSIRWNEDLEHTNFGVKRIRKKPPPKQCPHCQKFIHYAGFSSHIARMHVEVPATTCDECGKECRNLKVLKIHKYQHMRSKKVDEVEKLRSEYFCKECKKQYASRAAFKIHMETLKHMPRDQYAYECDICKKKWHSKRALEAHIKYIHLKLKEHKCDICNKAYSKICGLRRHKLYVHDKLVKERKHVCHLCGKSFVVQKSLEEHINLHQGLRPHKCPLCPATFTYRAALFTHNRLKHLKLKGRWKKKPSKKGKKSEVEESTTDFGSEDI